MPEPIRCIVVDDEPLAVELLADYLRKPRACSCFENHACTRCIAQRTTRQCRSAFLDIQMPELTGIQFMKISRNACPVILTTAYAEYALEGYEYDVVDYLLKPVTFERFMIAVEKAKRRLGAPKEMPQPVEHIFIKTEYRIQKIDLDDILYIEALRDYIAIHTLPEKYYRSKASGIWRKFCLPPVLSAFTNPISSIKTR